MSNTESALQLLSGQVSPFRNDIAVIAPERNGGGGRTPFHSFVVIAQVREGKQHPRSLLPLSTICHMPHSSQTCNLHILEGVGNQ